MKRVFLLAVILVAGAGCFGRPASPSPEPKPVPIGEECRSYASCREGQACPSGTECSGLPAYGCYPPGCPTPICLGSNAFIAGPDGEVRVREVREGMIVWTLDDAGNRVAAPILKVSRATVEKSHRMIHLVLEDGRQVWASPGHPTADGRGVETLRAGDMLDGSAVESAEETAYWDDATYDLLPAGETGAYWANGILLGSTLEK